MEISDEEFKQRIIDSEKDIALLVSGINDLMLYPLIRYGERPDEHDVLADMQLSILLAQVDISIGIKNMTICKGVKNEFEEYYFARILALNCYEILENDLKNFNKPLLEYRVNRKTRDIVLRIDECLENLKLIKRMYNEKLRKIRHNIVAHRLGKSIDQNRLMKSINPEEIFNISLSIQENYVSMLIVLPELQRAIGV